MDTTLDASQSSQLRIRDAQLGALDLEEVASDASSHAAGWQSLYSAYGCVCNHNYAVAERLLMSALREGGGDDLLKGRTDMTFLCEGLTKVAKQLHEPDVTETSCDAQVLQGLLENLCGNRRDAIDLLKKVALNNPSYPLLAQLDNKIRAMEFGGLGDGYFISADVLQTGGNKNRPVKWLASKLPLKVYIPPDAVAMKVKGYQVGDGRLLREAFDIWQKQSAGKVAFVYKSEREQADIVCSWTSEPSDLHLVDAIGVCSQFADSKNYLSRAEIQILTFTEIRPGPTVNDNQFRLASLEEVCLHEIGHSVGLNHSPSDRDLMYFQAKLHPLAKPSAHDMLALNSLYVPRTEDFMSIGFDALDLHQNKDALAAFDKAIAANQKNDQMRNRVSNRLFQCAIDELRVERYTDAIDLLRKAEEIGANTLPKPTLQQLRKRLHFALLQSGRLKEAQALEKQDPSLQNNRDESASYLDQYGVKPDAIPFYEQALAKSPDDLAVRDKFCFLLVMLARDESNKDHDEEALSLLTRAKSLLRKGMQADVIGRVKGALHREYLKLQMYEQADRKDDDGLFASPTYVHKNTSKEDMAGLVAAARLAHPADWSRPGNVTASSAKVQSAYNEYVSALKLCANAEHVKDVPAWAVYFIVKHNQHTGRSVEDPLGKMFALRRSLIALTDESAVVQLEHLVSLSAEH